MEANPLLPLHRSTQAEFQHYGDVEIVQTFGEPQAEYAAVYKSAGLMDLPHRGVIEVTGADRLAFLNNLLTNQVYDKQSKQGLQAGQGVYALMLNNKTGRITFDLNVLERGDRTLLETDLRLVDTLIKELDRYRFAEKVKFTSLVGRVHQIALHGPGAGALLEGICNSIVSGLGAMQSTAGQLFGQDAVIWRDDPCGVPGFYVIASIEAITTIWQELLSRFGESAELGKRVLRPIGWAIFNTLRIEAGRALFGIDFGDQSQALETGDVVSRAVSFTKGCYPGQEVVARMVARKQVAREIVGMRLAEDALPLAGAIVEDDAGNQVGGVTSSTISPLLSNNAICLATMKKGFTSVGTVVNIPAEGKMRRATITALPLVPRD